MESTVSIPPVSSAAASDSDRKRYVVAWLLCFIFYSMEYASRSSSSVMVPELGKAFGTTAMIPYTIVKEVNPDSVKGSATGAMNFITFGISAIIGPLFGKLVGPGFLNPTNPLQHFKESLWFWIGGIVLAFLLAIPLRETGKAHVRT